MHLYFQTIVKCHFYHAFQKFLKDLCSIDVLTTLTLMKFLMISNLAFARSILPIWLSLSWLIKSTVLQKKMKPAFDAIDHKILLYNLEHYGFRGVVLGWFKNYLSNRTQYVSYNNCKSSLRDIVCGVPQGSILGPLLFILYVNDITFTSNVLDFILFADDTTILYSHKDINSQVNVVNKELKEVSNWYKANKLSVNASKTNYMILGTLHTTSVKVRKDLNVSLNNTTRERVRFTKFLGVLIDECLTWKQHIDCVSKTISRNIDVMNKLKYSIPGRILHTLYCTLITPYLNYGILIWGSTCRSYLDKLIKLQKWAIRTITNSRYRSHTGPLFAKSNLLNVTDMYTLDVGVFMYKSSLFVQNLVSPQNIILQEEEKTSLFFYFIVFFVNDCI